MRRKLFGFTGLALLLAGALGSASVSALSGDEMSPVSDDSAIQVLGGAYCPSYYVVSTTACGGAVSGKLNCPYQNTYASGRGSMGTVQAATCFSCGVTCGTNQLLSPGCNVVSQF
jgi:hypothetical protein